MKNLKEMLNEQLLNEASTQWKAAGSGNMSKGVDDIDFMYRGNLKYGFLSYLPNEETVCLTAANSPEEFADAYSMELDGVKKMFDLSVGDSMKDPSDCYVMRIW